MSIQIIAGSSGAGKSHYIYNKIIKESMEDLRREYLVIVPEQFTMQTQKKLVHMHPAGGILNIDVLSFQRLAYSVFQEVGGENRLLLEETGKTLVLQKVVQKAKKEMKYLGSQMSRPGYIQEMKSLISELMQYDIHEDEMRQMQERCDDKPLLSGKLCDVEILYRRFRDYLQDKFITGEEVLDVLCEKLPLSEKLKNSTVVLDGFTGFTPIQYKVLEQLMVLCPQIYVTVTLGEEVIPSGTWKPYELFAMSRQMVRSLQELAVKTGCTQQPVETIHHGEHSRFAGSPGLHHLEKSLFRYGKHTYEGRPEDVFILETANPMEEIREVSRRIISLIREEGWRYGDMAVITGDLDTYGNYARRIFQQMDIPCFIDRKHSVLMNPFVEYIRSALDVMAQNFTYESVFRHLRCGLTDIAEEEIDRLENYVLALGIRSRKQWEQTWVRVYRGMAADELLEINAIRKRAIAGLLEFAESFKKRGNTVQEDTVALYQYIVRGDIQKKLKLQEQFFAAAGDRAMEKEYAQIYGIVMNLLDKLVEILGDEKISQKDYVQLVEAGLSEATVGIIPPSVDQVLVGDMQRTRLKDVKALFFVGVNDGIIPENPGRGGLLSEQDREFFRDEGVVLAPTPREAMYMQRFYLYLNLTKPSGRVYLSYSLSNAQGENLGPAYLVGTLMKLYPDLQVEKVRTDSMEAERFQRPQNSIQALVSGLRRLSIEEPEAGWKELYSWFAAQPAYHDFLKTLTEAAFYSKPEDVISKSVAKVLFGEVSVHSATRLEQYSACAFAHYLRYGLALSQRVEYEFTPMDMGNVMHNALEEFSGRLKRENLKWVDLSEEERRALAQESLNTITNDYGNTILHSSARNEYMIRRAGRLLERTVWALQQQLKNSEFVPEGFEVSIGGGRIDRLDICESENKVYVKVMDYKTGNTTFDLLGIYHGLQLQLMVYLDGALEIERKNHPHKDVEPAGVFYYNIKDPMINTTGAADVENLAGEILKKLKMNGLVTNDRTVLKKLDNTLESLPVSLNKDGSYSRRSSVADQERFALLQDFVNHKLMEIRESIQQGDARVSPYELGNRNACTYCPYSSVCGFDEKVPGYTYRRLKQFSDEQIWEAFREEVSEHGHELDR